jgi:hypothetical protein
VIGNFASLEPLPPKTKHAAPPLNAKKEYIASLRPKPCAAFSKNLACWSGYLAVDSTPYTSQEPVVDSTSPRSKYTDSSPYFAEILEADLVVFRVWFTQKKKKNSGQRLRRKEDTKLNDTTKITTQKNHEREVNLPESCLFLVRSLSLLQKGERKTNPTDNEEEFHHWGRKYNTK